jgi:prepilin-type N-terminal cleavage/methylation domain-containing protein
MPKNQRGFTVLELMVVMSIIAIMAALTTDSITNQINQKRSDTTIQETQLLIDAARSYRMATGTWPGNATCSNAVTVLTTSSPAYLSGMATTNKFNSAVTTSCTATTFSVDQNAVADWDGYVVNSLPQTQIVNAATSQLRTTVGIPGSEPALDAKLSRIATGNAELNRMRTNLLLGNNNIAEVNNITASSGNITTLAASSLTADNASITNLGAGTANITNLNATTGNISNLGAGNLSVAGNAGINGQLGVAGQSQFYSQANFSGPVVLNMVVSENTGCTPWGALARDGSGKTLSCQSGIWKGAGGVNTQTATCAASGTFNAECVASCPAGTKILSGGCQTPNHGAWEINSSSPSGNGWYCQASEDYGTGYYYQTVNGYAICGS